MNLMCLQTHGKVAHINNAQNFLIEFYQVYQKLISSTCESMSYLLEKARCFCAKNLSNEEF